jgi:hypothetical protein
MMSAAVAGTTFRPTPSYTTLRDVTRIASKTDDWDHSYRWCSVAGLVRNARGQIHDVAGYGAILAARVEHDGGNARATALLTAIVERAAAIDVLASELGRLLIAAETSR